MAATLWRSIYPKFSERFRRGIINICTCSYSEAMHSCAQYGTDCISAVESRRKHREIHSGSSHGSAKIWHLFHILSSSQSIGSVLDSMPISVR